MQASDLLTCVYLAMGLDSTAYTLAAPAWTAKKDRIPDPQHTSRTTYRDRKRRGGVQLKLLKYIHAYPRLDFVLTLQITALTFLFYGAQWKIIQEV